MQGTQTPSSPPEDLQAFQAIASPPPTPLPPAYLFPSRIIGRSEEICTAQIGGLSGEPLREMATEVLKEMYRLTKGELPIIACGGVSNGVHAYEKIRAGANVYTQCTES